MTSREIRKSVNFLFRYQWALGKNDVGFLRGIYKKESLSYNDEKKLFVLVHRVTDKMDLNTCKKIRKIRYRKGYRRK